MPRIPTYESQVNEIATPGARYQSRANADTFGANTWGQIGKVADAVENFSSVIMRNNAVQDAEKKKSQIRDTLVQARTEALQLQSEINALKGSEAQDAFNLANKKLTEIRQKYSDQFQDDDSKEMFKASFDPVMMSHLEHANGFQSKSREDFKAATMAAENKTAIDEAIQFQSNPAAIAKSEETVILNTRAKNRGMPESVVKQEEQTSIHNLHLQIVNSKIQADPKGALDYVNANWDKFDPSQRDALKKNVTDKSDQRWVEDEAIRLQALPLQTALAEVDKVQDADRAKKLRVEVKMRSQEKESIKDISEKESFNTEYDKLIQKPMAYVVPATLTVEQEEKLRAVKARLVEDELAKAGAKGMAAKQTNWDTYYKLSGMPESEFKKLDLTKYLPELGSTEFKELVKKQRMGGDEYMQAQTFTTYMNQFTKEQAKDDFEKASFLRQMFEAELNKYPASDRNKQETWNKVKDSLLLDVDVKGSFFDTPYWKARMNQKEIAGAEMPASVPKEAKWIDKTIEGQAFTGWEHVDPNGVKRLYSINGKIYTVK
jgi:hypothetical protein